MAGRGTRLLNLLRYRASRPVHGRGVRSRVGETAERYGGLLGRLADIPERGGEAGRSGPTFDGLVACRGHPESASVASLRLFTINRKASRPPEYALRVPETWFPGRSRHRLPARPLWTTVAVLVPPSAHPVGGAPFQGSPRIQSSGTRLSQHPHPRSRALSP